MNDFSRAFIDLSRIKSWMIFSRAFTRIAYKIMHDFSVPFGTKIMQKIMHDFSVLFGTKIMQKIMHDFSIAQRHGLIVERHKGQQSFPFSDNLLNLSKSLEGWRN